MPRKSRAARKPAHKPAVLETVLPAADVVAPIGPPANDNPLDKEAIIERAVEAAEEERAKLPEADPAVAEATTEQVAEEALSTAEEIAGDEWDVPKVVRSVVKAKYRRTYRENARRLGLGANRAAKRSRWDWLAQQLAHHTLDSKDRLMMDEFRAILDANGVKWDHWTNRNHGWQGRFRMTGRLALASVVAETGTLKLPSGEAIEAPADWVEKHRV